MRVDGSKDSEGCPALGDAVPASRQYTLFPSENHPAGVPASLPPVVSAKGSQFVNVRRYTAPNWATSEGVARKRKLIERKGLPGFNGWKFITLTLDPSAFDHDPLTGFLRGRAKLAKFMFLCREVGLWSKSAKWAWKLEFQRNGWAHWHLLLEHRPKWSVDDLRTISRLWGLGRTNVEAVRTDDYAYSFKYAFKPIIQEDEDDMFGVSAYALPDWFMDHFRPSENGSRPSSFARVRFWQTSKGFYTGPAVPAPDQGEPQSCLVPQPVREIVDRNESAVQVVARDTTGRYLKSAVVNITGCLAAFWVVTAFNTLRGQAIGLAPNNFVVPISSIQSNKPWLIRQISNLNRLTPKIAETLPPQNWKTC